MAFFPTSYSRQPEVATYRSPTRNTHDNAVGTKTNANPVPPVPATLPSITQTVNPVLPIANLFDIQDIEYNDTIGMHFDTRLDHNFGKAPSDPEGVIVWFCCCGEGPIGNWQNACVICHHPRCDKCKKEEHPRSAFETV